VFSGEVAFSGVVLSSGVAVFWVAAAELVVVTGSLTAAGEGAGVGVDGAGVLDASSGTAVGPVTADCGILSTGSAGVGEEAGARVGATLAGTGKRPVIAGTA